MTKLTDTEVIDKYNRLGNYANKYAAACCTGIGEDIIDECLAAKIVIRVTDGLPLQDAMLRSLKECQENKRDLGVIAISHDGEIAWGKTSEVILACYHDGEKIGDSLDWEDEDKELIDFRR